MEEQEGLWIQGVPGEIKAQKLNGTGSPNSPVPGASSTPLKARS